MDTFKKKYNDALERAKAYHRNELSGTRKEITEYIFPELRESEDEEIYREIYFIVHHSYQERIDNLVSPKRKKELLDKWEKVKAWLEKQKEQKQEWSEEDKKLIDDVINSLCCYQNTLSDYQKEIVGEEIRKLKSLCPQWKPSEQKEQKLNKWSKKDKKILQSLHHVMNCADAQNAVKRDGLRVEDVCTFLFSIEPNWKPSEEQMKALNAMNCYGELSYQGQQQLLIDLYQQLKKL